MSVNLIFFDFLIETIAEKHCKFSIQKFFVVTLLLSQAAACEGLVYSVNFNGQNSGTQGYALPLFED